MIIPLIIQTIRRDPSGPDAIDGVPNVSRPDPTGADQSDAEHQATDLAIEEFNRAAAGGALQLADRAAGGELGTVLAWTEAGVGADRDAMA